MIPVRDEEDNVTALVDELVRHLASRPSVRYEIIFVDDGSTDRTVERLRRLRRDSPAIRIIRLDRHSGQSAAVLTGVRYARATWIVTLDGDGQNDPADIWQLWDAALQHTYRDRPVLVVGYRAARQDSLGKKITSRALNALSAACLRHERMDKGCSLKVFRRDDFLQLPRFDHMHRFLPALFQFRGATIISLPVGHRPRRSGSSHYTNSRRVGEAIIDVAGIMWLQRRAIDVTATEEKADDGE